MQELHALPGLLIIASGPSGAGKNSVFKKVLEQQRGKLEESVSCTTRAKRPGEVDGREYYFISEEEFSTRVRRGYFLEYDEHFKGRYGTPLQPVLERLKQGVDVVLVIDVRGAKMAAKKVSGALTIFIMPAGSTVAEQTRQLTEQLADRGSEAAAQVDNRLNRAAYEIGQAKHYQHVVINAPDKLDDAVAEVNEIIERARRAHQQLSVKSK